MGHDTEAPAEGHPDYALDEQIGYLIRLAKQRHSEIFQRNALHDLTPTQFSAMIRLLEIGECSQNELGRQTTMDVATTKGVVQRMSARGMIALKADPNDKRRKLLSIPADQRDIAPQLYEMGNRITRETLEPLTANEQTVLLRLLKKLT